MKATIYIPEDKSEIYERAKAELGDSVSATFLRCLERELESKRIQTGRIVVEITYPEGRRGKKAFEGRWLIGNAGQCQAYTWQEPENWGVVEYSVALTKKRAIVVCVWNRDEEIADFQVYEDFEDFSLARTGERDTYPPSLISAVAAELDIDHVEEIDI